MLRYNNYTVTVEKVDGKRAIKFIDLCNLAGRSKGYFYGLLSKKKETIDEYLIKESHRRMYITLDGCIKFLNLCYMPDDGLITVIKRYIAEKEEPKLQDNEKSPTMVCGSKKQVIDADAFADVELSRIRAEKIKKDLDEQKIKETMDMILKKVKIIELNSENLFIKIDSVIDEINKCREADRRCAQDEPKSIKGFIKDLIKEIISEVLNG